MKQTYLQRWEQPKISPLSVLDLSEELTPQEVSLRHQSAETQGGGGFQPGKGCGPDGFKQDTTLLGKTDADQRSSPAACYRAPPRRAVLCNDDSLDTPKVCCSIQ